VPTINSNHLTNGILKYFGDAGRYLDAAAFFAPLFAEDPEVGATLAYCYIQCDEELKAVKVMHEASKKYPVPYQLLVVQIDFLMSKKKYDKALMLAKLAVTRAPSEYIVWEKLTLVFLELEDYESALLALNSCPMFTFVDKDSHRMPPPARTHLPLKVDHLNPNYDPKTAPNTHGRLEEDNDPRENEVHPEIRRLPSISLRGTFNRAYDLLCKVCQKVGWDELLKYRSKVFVMEEEYRIHRAIQEEEAQQKLPFQEDEEEDVNNGMEIISLDDPQKSLESPQKKKGKLSIDELVKKASANPNLSNAFDQPIKGKVANNPRLPFTGVNFTFRHKRLCEKWLDNLFMVLYNDLRIYTAMKQEMKLFKQEQTDMASQSNLSSAGSIAVTHRKNGAEWEIYGNIAVRLGHQEDAVEAYRQCLDQMLSTSALIAMIRIYAKQGDILNCLQLVNRMVSCLDRVFAEETYPSPIASSLFTVIRKNGLTKVQNALVAMNINPTTFRNITYIILT
jgi:tetratricopeptide (TPR) repeat protein